MRRAVVALALALAATGCATPGPAPSWPPSAPDARGPRVTSFEVAKGVLSLATTAGPVVLDAVNAHVVRVRAARGDSPHDLPRDFSWAVVPGASAPRAAFTVADEGASLLATVEPGAVRVRVEKDPLRLAFLDAEGRAVSEDAPGRPLAFGPDGFRVEKTMPADEHYYGLGDKAGPLDRRGMAFANWNTDAYGWQESSDPLYKTIPFFLGLRGGRAYGLFVDAPTRSWFDFGKAARDDLAFGAEGPALDYYYLAGPAPKDVLERYADLTGKPPLPPLWALGYQQCRYSYFPEARVREIARTFRDKKIPADVIYLDIDYQKDNRPFTIDRERFPHFEAMVQDLAKGGFHVVAITDLHVARAPGQGYRPYDEGAAGDHFVHAAGGSVYVGKVWPGESVFPDFTWAPARAWWGTLYRDFVAMGIGGFWNDMNEPSVFVPDKTMPLDVVHRVDGGGTAPHRDVHNVYGMQNARATYEGLRALAPDQRPLVLTRATYAGGQRWAASWTGDNSSTWNHLRVSVPMLLDLGLSGFAFVGDDIGGFRGSPPADLLTRWIEVGAFNPIFRDHTEKGTLDQEPWVHGPEHEAIRRRYIEARYRLMPYLYTVAEEASRTGLPLMRPIWLEHPSASDFAANDRAFLFGPDLLVEPKLDETLDPLDVVVPPGAWFDYWTGARVAGGTTLRTRPGLGDLSVLVRGGAILPHAPLVQSTSETPRGPLELRVYPGPDCRGSLYLDDGTTFAYERGASLRLAFSCVEEERALEVAIGRAEGAFAPWFDEVTFEVHGAPSRPARVMVGGRPVRDFAWDAARGVVTVTVPYDRTGSRVTLSY